MRAFDYVRPGSISEMIALLDTAGDGTRLLAGGTDLLPLMKHNLTMPERLVDIKRLPELNDAIEPTVDGGLRIGALATLAQVEVDPLVRGSYTALADAAAIAATPQLRNMATIGGNLLQRPRCWYYRSEHITCWLKGGDDCPARLGDNRQHALFGESPCVAAHPSDPPTALMALDATVEVMGPDGGRRIPISAFYAEPTDERRTETTLQPREVITAVLLPPPGPAVRSTFIKAMDRKVWAFALGSVAVRIEMDGERIGSARVVLGGVATIPWRSQDAEKVLIGGEPGPDLLDRAADAALKGAAPLTHNGYKAPLLRTLVRRALEQACQ